LFDRAIAGGGRGARLGGFEGTDIGIGPVVTLIHTSPKDNFSVQAKWLRELDTKNRVSGDRVWVLAGAQF
jgi:hypothetical protein